ncbi:AMP-dependent synthetase [Moorena producens PAL-8-15-08-1]|uniref:AMP-dependent synthetase n=1 Tax=Moorena producens PAL-8-15-08-1 TaxID=1458985 RepID=A0A1D8TPX5_9CYAN|nr:fatty acyl-AMP ligase [Moorena producens]AOW99697.1 AMP-dependent synthetase [Moorena producens PAL-8-15-08-1]
MNTNKKFTSLIDLLCYRGTNEPNQKAYTFISNGKTETASLTYGELEKRSRAIAAQLQEMGVTRGERALLLYSQPLDFICAFFGCLYAGVIAIPAPPPDAIRLKRTLPRLQACVKDAQVSLVLTTSQISSQFPSEWQKDFGYNNMLLWLFTEEISEQLANQWQELKINLDAIAYLQYTSGSTSTPKGVVVTHNNVMHHSAYIKQAWNYTSDSIAATWMPYFHDYGLIDGLIQPIYSGITCYVMSPLTFVRRPTCWLEVISKYKVTHSQSPNFGYDYCVRQVTSEQLTNLDLRSWKTASNGAEPIRKDTIEKFIKTFEPCGFRPTAFFPAYGLAEATLLVATKSHNDVPEIASIAASALEKNQIVECDGNQKGTRYVVSCGFPICGIKVIIVNLNTLTRCASDEVGEIWVSDLSVAQGYWNRPEETKHTFEAYLADTGEGPFLRTGDLGFIKNGQLFVTGRLKDVIIIRGQNHYPQDIEFTVEQSHPALRKNSEAAFGVEVDGEEKLVVVQEVERSWLRKLDFDQVNGDIRQALMEQHELQVYAIALIQPGSIPKTSSGKIMRQACRIKFLEGTLEVINSGGGNPEHLRKLTVMSVMRATPKNGAHLG